MFYSEIITGFGTDSDDVTFNGNLSTTVALAPDTNYAIQFMVYPDETVTVPEPATIVLISLGDLLLRKRRT